MHTSESKSKPVAPKKDASKNEPSKHRVHKKEREYHSASDKRWVWIPHPAKTFVRAFIVSEFEASVIAQDSSGAQYQVLRRDIQKMNPAKFDMIEDLAGLSHLNEASVLNNLTMRFKNGLIYTYSGLFLLVVNPYRNLKIYAEHEMVRYSKKQKYELPPHIFAIANHAYNSMLINKEDQSILITGESGAGKTENTKKVINYLTFIAGSQRGGDSGKQHLNGDKNGGSQINIEQQIINTNPILEAFGNAKTTRNDNSSRFGKFIKVEFDRGFIVGASVEKYLLEKSRVTKQSENEQNYHIFYQLLSGANKELRKEIYLDRIADNKREPEPYTFRIVNNYTFCQVHVDDFKTLISCLESLNFSEIDVKNIFRILSAILHMGNITFHERNEQAEIEDMGEVEIVCKLLDISVTDFIRCILHPLSRAGNEMVINQRNKEQASKVIEALCGIVYEQLFESVIHMINRAIYKSYGNYENSENSNINKPLKNKISRPSIVNYNPNKTNFIGILDIAGFEIFKENDFEQLCINYTNEKLQQFFNHHMFILEQEIYRRENIEWNYIDFGKDLQPTIDMIEKNNPIGIFAFLDEECVMPGANDQTFFDKLKNNIKSEKFKVSRFKEQFQLEHYAGIVNYRVKEWIRKNKEPYFENLSELLSKSGNDFISSMFKNHYEVSNGSESTNKRNREPSFIKKGYFRTLAQKHKEQLSILMRNLNRTNPHFVRCLLPNSNKAHDLVDKELILKQLRCNGVLEGIRISRLGFPTRVLFEKFVERYKFIIEGDLKTGTKQRETCDKDKNNFRQHVNYRQQSESIISHLKLSPAVFRIGETMVFLKMGVLADIEEMRDEKASLLAVELQSWIRRKLTIKKFLSNELKKKAQLVLQRNFLVLKDLQNFSWWRLYLKIKPLLDIEKIEDQKKEQMRRISQLEEDLDFMCSENDNLKSRINEIEFELEKRKKEVDMTNLVVNEKDELLALMRNEKVDFENKIQALNAENETQKSELEKLVNRLKTKNQEFECEIERMRDANDNLKKQNDDLCEKINKLELECSELNSSLKNVSDQNMTLANENKNLKIKENELENKLLSQLNKDEEIQKMILEKEVKIQNLEMKSTASEDSIKNLDAQVKERDGKIMNLKNKEQTRNHKIREIKNKIGEMKNEIESDIKNDILRTVGAIKSLNLDNFKKIQSLNLFISRQIKQIDELNEIVQQKEKENEDLEVENENSQNTIRNFERNARRQEIEFKKMKDEVEMKQITIENLEKRINELNDDKNAELNCKNINNSLSDGNLNNNPDSVDFSASKEKESLISKIKALEKTNKKITLLLKEEKIYNSQLKDELDNIHSENLSVMQKKFDEIFKKESEMNSERKAWNLKIKTLESENESLKLSIAEKISTVDESNNSSEGMLMALEEERAKCANLRKLLINQENKNLELFNSVEKIKTQMKDEIDEKNGEIETLKKNLKQLEDNENAKKEIQGEIQIIQSQVRLLSAEYQKIFLEKINFYKKLLLETENELNLKINTYEIEKKSLNSTLNLKDDEIESLTLKIEELEMKLDKSVTELQNTLDHEIAQNKYLKNKNDILEGKIRLIELKRGAKDSQEKISDLMNLSTKSEISKFAEEFDQKLKNLTNECKELRQYKQKYETQLKLTEAEIKRKALMQEEFDNTKAEMSSLKSQLEAMSEKIISFDALKKNLEEENTFLNKQIEAKNLVIRNQKTESDNIQQEIEGLRRFVKDLEERIEKIKVPEIEELKTDCQCAMNIDDNKSNGESGNSTLTSSREAKYLARLKKEQEISLKNKDLVQALKDEVFELKRVINQNNISIKQLERDLSDKESLLGFYKTLSTKKK